PYHPDYYAAFVLDPDGNNIEVVYHGPARRSAPSVQISFDLQQGARAGRQRVDRSGKLAGNPVAARTCPVPRIRRWLPILLALVLLLLWFAWRQWRGPEIPAYQLEQRPLVQRVVARREVDSQSLAQVGSEFTGVGKGRAGPEGDGDTAGGLLLARVLLLPWFAWRQGRRPGIPDYQVERRPLVQRVVASGEVGSQSLAQVGSEITGVVKRRHVRQGDAVRAGDLLIELHDEEQ